MIYNNGQVFTNQWARWTGASKISGEEYQIFSTAPGNGTMIR